MTFQSIASKNGNLAERLICDSINVSTAILKHLDVEGRFELVGGRKKSDYQIITLDRVIRFQNKNGNIDGRGHSVNRSSLNVLTKDENAKNLINNVCIIKGTDRPSVGVDISSEIIDQCLFGNDSKPEYFTHTKITHGQISELYICPIDVLMKSVVIGLYPQMLPKRTCVHLSSAIYLQRKGGGKKDHSPDDIQMKFRLAPFIHLFTRLI
jgi:hypothetical protein